MGYFQNQCDTNIVSECGETTHDLEPKIDKLGKEIVVLILRRFKLQIKLQRNVLASNRILIKKMVELFIEGSGDSTWADRTNPPVRASIHEIEKIYEDVSELYLFYFFFIFIFYFLVSDRRDGVDVGGRTH